MTSICTYKGIDISSSLMPTRYLSFVCLLLSIFMLFLFIFTAIVLFSGDLYSLEDYMNRVSCIPEDSRIAKFSVVK